LKVHCEEVNFKPVMLTLETEGELLFITKLIGGASHSTSKEYGVDSMTHSRIYDILEATAGVDRCREVKDLLVELSKF
jgi:hypothetical protein